MPDQEVLAVQQGIWIDQRWIHHAGLGSRLRVVVEPGEIRIVPVPPEDAPQDVSEEGWEVFRSLGDDGSPGRLPNAAVEHDRYLYGKGP